MLKSLIAIRLSSFFSALIGRGERKRSKTILFAVLYLYLAVVLVGMVVLYSYFLGASMLPLGLGAIYLAIFIIADFSLIFLLGIFETKAELFDCKDNELLLSMPIKPSTILLSRILTVLIYNLVFSVGIMLPSAIVYIVLLGGEGLVGFFGLLVCMLVIPFPATALASVLGYFIAYLSKRLRYANLITVIASVAFLVAYFIFYMKLISDPEIFENIGGVVGSLAQSVPFIFALGAIALFKPLEFAAFLLVGALISFVAYRIISRRYVKIMTTSNPTVKVEYKAKRAKLGSALWAITKKEFMRIVSSSLYLMNGAIGSVMRPVLGVALIFKAGDVKPIVYGILSELGVASPDLALAILVLLLLAMLASMDTLSASAVSLEGKSLWIIRSLPVSPRVVLLAKTLPHAIISGVSSLVFAVMALVAFGGGIVSYLVVIPMVIIMSTAFAAFGTVVNVALPKFELENEAQVVKQALAVGVVMLGELLAGILTAVGAYFGAVHIGVGVTAILIASFYAALLLLLGTLMLTVSSRKFANL